MSFRQKLIKVRIITFHGTEEFNDLKEAHKKYPDLNLYRGSPNFTAALEDEDGFLRFETWEIYHSLHED